MIWQPGILSQSEMREFFSSQPASANDGEPLGVYVLRNVTVDPMVSYLQYFCALDRTAVNVEMGEFGVSMEAILDEEGILYESPPDYLVLHLALAGITKHATDQFTRLTPRETLQELDGAVGLVASCVEEFCKRSKATVIIHTFEVPPWPCYGIFDCQNPDMQLHAIRRANLRLTEAVGPFPNAYVVDTELLQSRVGNSAFFDARYRHIAKNPYSRTGHAEMAREYSKIIRARSGKTFKCLVLDCDNTLWGGVVGDVGTDGIVLGHSYPGSAYLDFQKVVLGLHDRGVILALCSKNDEKSVLDVLENHPQTLLKTDHFAAMRVNWQDKASNINSLAEELNISLDSIVFADDSRFETSLVDRLLPEVVCLELPVDPTQTADYLRSYDGFDSLRHSKEDKARNTMYRQEAMRNKGRAKHGATDITEYLRFLQMELLIDRADEFSHERVAQLTERTNQWNLTGGRYSLAQVEQLSRDSSHEILVLRVHDRFGDSGITGCAILRFDSEVAVIEALMVSCRVLGRGVENAFLMACCEFSRAMRAKEVRALYSLTEKNGRAEGFYPANGFAVVGKKSSETVFSRSIDGSRHGIPSYFESVSLLGKELTAENASGHQQKAET